MSTSIFSDSMVLASGPDGPVNTLSGQSGPVNKLTAQNEVDFARCDCCGLTEECTPSYIQTIRERYGGKWICGLCAEAVKDEILRCQRLISPDEAMARHFNFCNKFRASCPMEDPTIHLIRAMARVMSKSLEGSKSTPCSPTTKRGNFDAVMTRSESCIPSLTLVEASMYRGMDESSE